ncbi:MAG TPA: glycosyltransferase family 4 protein [Chthoniobacterales bacterium]|nr:glycosyltransferase family 4 protein [Chthoniobacterales bacterium]
MSNGKIKIAFVRRGYSPSGGAEAYLKRLAQGVADRGHEAHLVATDEWPAEEWPSDSITRVHGDSPIAFADEVEKLRPQVGCNVLMSLERVWRCDVYRAGDGVHQAWLNRRQKFEMPLQRFVRGINRKHQDILKLEEALFRKAGAGRVIANSEMVKREVVDLYRYPTDKIEIVRTGVPLEKFRLDPAEREKSRAELKLKPEETALLFAGSGWERKGLRFAIEACELSQDRKLRLLVAGRGDQSGYRPKRFFTEEPVRFLGEVADLRPIYAASDIFILPSIYDPFSNACLEALAVGLPVITTRDNGFSEIIEDGVHGSIVDFPSNVSALRNAIGFWSDESRRAAARSANIERASDFDISTNVEATLKVLFQSARE